MEYLKLLKKYNLHKSPEVESAAKRTEARIGDEVSRGDTSGLVTNYLKRLREVADRVSQYEKERGIKALKKVVSNLFITKYEEIPQNYWNIQANILRDRGQGGDWARHSDEKKQEVQKENAKSLISDQWASLEQWVDYFTSNDSNHIPDTIKYWTFRNIVKLAEYNKEAKEFPKRSKGTVKMFPDLNMEALAYVVDKIKEKYSSKKHEETNGFDFTGVEKSLDESQKQYLRVLLKQKDFSKLYAWSNEIIRPIPEDQLQITEGKWVKYDQGSNYMPLVKSIAGKGTGWCTAGEGTAQAQLKAGDFHVYYSNDDDGSPTNPRIAIRMEDGGITEVRGIAEKQNLDQFMNSILSDKLTEFSDGDKYLKKEQDMSILTKIYQKHQDSEELSNEDLKFLYEIESKIKGFGYIDDPRIKEIKAARSIKQDLAKATGFKEEEISTTKEEALSGGIKFHYGNLYLSGLTSAKGLVLPEIVNGNIGLNNLSSVKGLVLPKTMNGDLGLENLLFADGLVLPKTMNGNLDLGSLISTDGLVLPETMSGKIWLSSLTSADGLVLPKTMNGDLDLRNLTSAEGLVLPEIMNGGLDLSSLTSADGLVLPKTMNGNLYLRSLTSADGLVLPKTMNGDLWLNSLTSADGLVLPENMNGDLLLFWSFKSKIDPEKLKNFDVKWV